ncbi:MAG: NERD domain-containing protein [Erysipelotrichaceae bacterium]|nr:NERD domain-containing protein [Erysipelotrichaceae bacterium]
MMIDVLLYIILIFFAFFVCFVFCRPQSRNKSPTVTHQTIIPKKPLSEQETFGKRGEQQVSLMLKKVAESCGGHVFNDYTFADQQGFSTNIDHLLICKGGLFVIETKANKGLIYGNDNDDYWRAEKEPWQEDKEFKNPVRQNQGHINHLRRMMGGKAPKIISMVIFSAASSLAHVNSSCTYSLRSAYEYLISKANEEKYSPQTVERFRRILFIIQEEHGISIEEHNAIVRDRFSS